MALGPLALNDDPLITIAPVGLSDDFYDNANSALMQETCNGDDCARDAEQETAEKESLLPREQCDG